MNYHRDLVPALTKKARDTVTKYLSVPKLAERDFSFCCVTPALFSVMESITFDDEHDCIVTTDCIYHSLVDTLEYYKLAKKVRVHVVETPPNATQDTIFEAFQASLDELRKDTGVVVKLAVFDHISSKPSVVFPARRMCEFCRSLGIPTLVDAAHVPGTLRERDISVEDLGPTFYAVTFHKWCNALRPTGGLWVNRAEIEERYAAFVDMSSLTPDPAAGWSSALLNNPGSLYIDGKPGILVDRLTQGIYDESTRDYNGFLCLPLSVNITRALEEEARAHAKDMRARIAELFEHDEEWFKGEEVALGHWGGGRGAGEGGEEAIDFLPMMSVPLPTKKLLRAKCGAGRWDIEGDGSDWGKELGEVKKWVVASAWDQFAVEAPVSVWNGRVLHTRLSLPLAVGIEDVQRWKRAVETLAGIR